MRKFSIRQSGPFHLSTPAVPCRESKLERKAKIDVNLLRRSIFGHNSTASFEIILRILSEAKEVLCDQGRRVR
jgi:hypothetical protein